DPRRRVDHAGASAQYRVGVGLPGRRAGGRYADRRITPRAEGRPGGPALYRDDPRPGLSLRRQDKAAAMTIRRAIGLLSAASALALWLSLTTGGSGAWEITLRVHPLWAAALAALLVALGALAIRAIRRH